MSLVFGLYAFRVSGRCVPALFSPSQNHILLFSPSHFHLGSASACSTSFEQVQGNFCQVLVSLTSFGRFHAKFSPITHFQDGLGKTCKSWPSLTTSILSLCNLNVISILCTKRNIGTFYISLNKSNIIIFFCQVYFIQKEIFKNPLS